MPLSGSTTGPLLIEGGVDVDAKRQDNSELATSLDGRRGRRRPKDDLVARRRACEFEAHDLERDLEVHDVGVEPEDKAMGWSAICARKRTGSVMFWATGR